MADIKQIQVGSVYNIKDDTARSNMVYKHSADSIDGTWNFVNGLQIGGKGVQYSSGTITFDGTATWNFGGQSLQSGGYSVLTSNDIDVNNLVGKKTGNGEIVGDYTYNTANHSYSFVAGERNSSSASHQFICGKYNYGNQNNLFEIGGGNGTNSRKNIFEVDKYGSTSAKDFIIFNNDDNSLNGVGLINTFLTAKKTPFTNSSALIITTTDTTVLNQSVSIPSGEKGYLLGSIPVTMSLDGNIVITITTDSTSKQIKKYCNKGSELINFIFTLTSGTNSIEVKIKTEYYESDIRVLQANITSLTNYINNLSYVAPSPLTTAPTGSIASSSIELILIGA